ncbi:cache domain-containing protein [Duganella fentianensis]|uniref:cache domain-containing protein n=1 Tax=Duganella fentianensis TaxID=2692177 RepID=UPI0032B1FC82
MAVLLFHIFRQQDEHARTMAIARARTVMSVLDREFLRTHSVLKTLGNNGLWQERRFAEFHAEAQQSARDLGASSILLLEPGGQMILSTKRPFGTALPTLRSAPLLAQTISTGLPGISSLFVNPVDRQYIFTLSVPLRQNGEVTYSLNATYTPDALDNILAEQKLSKSWRAAIIDTQGKIVTRTHEAARFTGRPVLAKLLEKLNTDNEGAYDDVTLDGIPVMTAFSRSSVSKWSVVIGIPLEEAAAPVRAFVLQAVALLTLTLIIGMAIIWWLSAYLNKLANAMLSERGEAAARDEGQLLP